MNSINSINNDRNFRHRLSQLDDRQQRRLGARFLAGALELCADPCIRRGLALAQDPTAEAEELQAAFHAAKACAVHSYTECGRDTQWRQQAAHFIAVATACLLLEADGQPLERAWRVAMHIRNARNCAALDSDSAQVDNLFGDGDEARRQWQLTEAFLEETPTNAEPVTTRHAERANQSATPGL